MIFYLVSVCTGLGLHTKRSNLVVYIRDILHERHLKTKVVSHDPPEHIGGDIVSCMAEMSGIVDCWATAVPGDLSAFCIDWHEGNLCPGERVVDLEWRKSWCLD